MKTVSQHIEHIHGKPHHVRKRIAFTAAASGAALVAVAWFAGNLYLGAFSLQDNSFAGNTEAPAVVTADTSVGNGSLAGVAGALPSESAPAHIEIVDTTAQKSSGTPAEQTTIPF